MGTCKSAPLDGLCRPDEVAPKGVEVCPGHNPQCWDSVCATGYGFEGLIPPGSGRGKERRGH